MSKLSEAKEHYKKLKADGADKSLIKAAKKQYKALKKLKGTENGDESTTPSTKRQRSEETNASPPPAKKNKDQQTCAQNNNSTAQCIACNVSLCDPDQGSVVCVDCDDVWCKKCGNEDGVMCACVANEDGEGCGENVCDGCFKTTYCGRDVECCRSCFDKFIGECPDCDKCAMGRARDGQWR